MADDALLPELRAVVGGAHVLTDPELTASYEVDWTGRFRGRSRAVVRPADTAQVAAVLQACGRYGAPIVPQGGNTGLVGGAVPRGGEVVLGLRRLDAVGPVDPVAGQLTVGAGCTLSAARTAARAAGFEVGIDLAPRDSATVGGMVATNAGGEHVLRYGPMRRQVAGLEAVLADGRVVRRLHGLAKDTAGYDVVSLLTGSEGTLAVVTAVRLQLVAPDEQRAVALLAVEGLEELIRLTRQARDRLPRLAAAEFFLAAGRELVGLHLGRPAPVPDAPAYLLLESAGPVDELVAALDGAAGTIDAAVATTATDRAALWRWREAHAEAINARGVPVKLDVAVPLPALARLLTDLPGVVPDGEVILFGHAAEGNVHVNVLGVAEVDKVEEAVLQRVVAVGGTISAEHGIGVAKARWLHLCRDAADIAVMRAIKHAWDPTGMLNPGALFPS